MNGMKDSGVDIINSIPESWTLTRLKYLCQIETGDSDTQDAEPDGEYPFYVRSPIVERSTSYTFDGEGILMAGDGAGAGRIFHHAFGKYAVHQRVYRLSKFQGISSDYLFYYLQNLFDRQMDKGSAQSTVPSVRLPMLQNFYVCVPSKKEQVGIAKYVAGKCAEVDVTSSEIRVQIDALEQYKRSVITEVVTKGLRPDVEMTDSRIQWIGMMPAHWECIRGKYVLKYVQKPVREDDGVITCFRDGEVTLRSNRREDGFTMADKEIGYQGIDIGDLVVHGMDGFAGAIGISDSRGKASPVLNVLETDQNKRYIMYFLRSMAYSDVFLALATGIRVRSCDLRWNKLSELFYPIPPLEEQEAIVAHIDDVIEKTNAVIADKKAQLETLEEYKKSLIFEYVTGKKEVPIA